MNKGIKTGKQDDSLERQSDWPNEYSVRQGDQGFNPRSSHTKNSKNVTWCRFAKNSAL